jgi:hypothetical protein
MTKPDAMTTCTSESSNDSNPPSESGSSCRTPSVMTSKPTVLSERQLGLTETVPGQAWYGFQSYEGKVVPWMMFVWIPQKSKRIELGLSEALTISAPRRLPRAERLKEFIPKDELPKEAWQEKCQAGKSFRRLLWSRYKTWDSYHPHSTACDTITTLTDTTSGGSSNLDLIPVPQPDQSNDPPESGSPERRFPFMVTKIVSEKTSYGSISIGKSEVKGVKFDWKPPSHLWPHDPPTFTFTAPLGLKSARDLLLYQHSQKLPPELTASDSRNRQLLRKSLYDYYDSRCRRWQREVRRGVSDIH